MSSPLLAVLGTLAAALAIRVVGARPMLRESITYAAAAGNLLIVLSMLPTVLAGGGYETDPYELLPGVAFQLRTDPFGLLFALVASTLWLVTSVYSVGDLRAANISNQTGYFASFAICVSATVGIAFAANLFTFFLFYEVLTIATYPLVVHNRTPEAIAGGRKYLLYTLAAGQVLLIAVIWTAFLEPGANFEPGGFLSAERFLNRGSLIALFLLFVLGVGVKAAIMPLHGWLPSAMVAPIPVSALLHAVAVVKAGGFGVLRVIGYVFGVDLLYEVGVAEILAVAAAITIIIASVRALGETNLKRRLAYSTVSQLSYVVLGAALGSVAAVAGAMFHIAAHGFMKITLFFCVGAIHTQQHVNDATQMKGIGRSMPLTMTAFAVGASGLAGIPLLAGFLSKWNLGIGALAASQPVFVLVLVASGLLNLAYFYPIVYDAFFRESEVKREEQRGDAPWTMTAPLVFTALIVLVLGVAPDFGFHFYSLAWMAAEQVVSSGVPVSP